ncbi:hypothetical protein EMCG_04601 [[Emmonsia] crescens]|uniref:Probable beta-glucosidase btgE n=1 Tax=[Emmonsia] crescens TaxID=73230 RepID=A0A0G2IYN2_9EURO|nr:hypothetical protein EMCG_04601 [Emmonsia crescens UAMH 3008]
MKSYSFVMLIVVYLCIIDAADNVSLAHYDQPLHASTCTATKQPHINALHKVSKRGIAYTPYTDDSQCKASTTIISDIALIKTKGFSTIRVYSLDCDILRIIGRAARAKGLKMIIGISIVSTNIEELDKQVADLVAWSEWDLVSLVVVGNEAIFKGLVNAALLAFFISACRQGLQRTGYSGPVTIAEPVNIWQSNGDLLCDAVDIIGANMHCFFNPSIDASRCGQFVSDQIKILKNVCGNKRVINLETGWPTHGHNNGNAIPGIPEQQKAIKSLFAEGFHEDTILFSFANELWKDPGPFEVEQSWGCMDVF